MKPLLRLVIALSATFLLVAAVPAAEPVYPRYSGFVNDYAGVLDEAAKAKLEGLCRELEAKTSAEMALAVVKSVAPLDSKSYAVKLFEQWQPGKKGQDNGLLIVLALDERRVEVEVGYGLEGDLNDAKVGALLDRYAVPYFKEGRFGDGLYNLAAALSGVIAAAAGRELGEEHRPAARTKDNWASNDTVLSIAVALIVIFSVFLSGLLAGIFGALVGGFFGFFLGGPLGALVGAALGFVLSYTRFSGPGGFGGWTAGTFGGGFGGGSEGGFGGFGGGSSGGGGAGRSW
jgi:uncharacterized protein